MSESALNSLGHGVGLEETPLGVQFDRARGISIAGRRVLRRPLSGDHGQRLAQKKGEGCRFLASD